MLGYAAAHDVFGASLYEPCGQIDQVGNLFGATATNRDTGGYHDKIRELRLKNLRMEEIPFSSERKRMTTVHQMADGRRMALMKGAPEAVLQRCTHVLEEDGIRELKETERSKILEKNGEREDKGMDLILSLIRNFRAIRFEDIPGDAVEAAKKKHS
jgi:magnesium-transporting ATPase (P-type)